MLFMIIPKALADAIHFLSCPNCLDKDDEEEMALLKNLEWRKQSEKILDVKWGTGKYSRVLLDDYRADLVFAVDTSMPRLKHATRLSNAREFEKIVYITADAGSLRLRGHMIDGAICMGALQL